MSVSCFCRTSEGWTPLHSACNWAKVASVGCLISHGADVNATSKGGNLVSSVNNHTHSFIHPRIESLAVFLANDGFSLCRICGRVLISVVYGSNRRVCSADPRGIEFEGRA